MGDKTTSEESSTSSEGETERNSEKRRERGESGSLGWSPEGIGGRVYV